MSHLNFGIFSFIKMINENDADDSHKKMSDVNDKIKTNNEIHF